MSLINKLNRQSKDLVDKAKTFANDPATREKIEEARGKLNEHVETAKHKLAEKKAKDEEAPSGGGSAAPPTYGEETPAPPASGEDGPKAA